jgi:hypothetical protein
MALLDDIQQIQAVDRVAEVERRSSGEVVKGDFEGSVTGYWVKLREDGAGIVSYNNKQYVTKPIGFTSLPAGQAVELSHANGVYFSSW